jgi:hypothetical protein
MRISIRGRVLLVGACILASSTAWAQQPQTATKQSPVSIDLAVTYAPERAQLVYGSCCFWLQGGGADAAVTWRKGFGLASSYSDSHASNVSSGVDVNKISYLAGPRYTYTARGKSAGAASNPRYQIFGQGLFGGVHGFDGVYPATSFPRSSANAFALEAGGGVNYYLTKNTGLRLFEIDYVRTELPNNADDVQNDLRLAFGFTYHCGR